MELHLPHLPPLKFAQKILLRDTKFARVEVQFPSTPSLAMLIESAAQSSAALNTSGTQKNASLVAMKNIKLHKSTLQKKLEVEVQNVHTFENMQMIDFKVYEGSLLLASGALTLAMEK